MAKDPILPLYYNDITTSTQDWTDEEFGAYMRLLIHQWRQGGLPKDYQRLTRIATSLATTWPLLKVKFPEVDGLLKNPVMEEIREKREKHRQKQSNNVSKRYQKSTNDNTKTIPLESENENENENVDDTKREVKEGDVLSLTDECFADIFNSLALENIRGGFPKHNLENELKIFKAKVRGSPERYRHRDAGGIKQAFIYQLSHSKATDDVTRKRNEKSIRRPDASPVKTGGGGFGKL